MNNDSQDLTNEQDIKNNNVEPEVKLDEVKLEEDVYSIPKSLIKTENPLVLRRVSDLVVSVFRFFTQTVGQTGISEEHVDLFAEASKDSSFWSHAQFHVKTSILNGFNLVKVLVTQDSKMDTLYGVVLEQMGKYYIVFRGSQVAGDWWANFNFRTVSEMGFWLQAGYVEFFRSIKEQLTEIKFSANSEIYVCGHSLGGALAALTAVHLYQHGYHGVRLYLFGSPKVGDATFQGYIHRSFRALHFQRETDITPIMGTKWSYVSVGETVILPSQVSRWSFDRAHDVREYRRGVYELLGLGNIYRPLYLKTHAEINSFFNPVKKFVHWVDRQPEKKGWFSIRTQTGTEMKVIKDHTQTDFNNDNNEFKQPLVAKKIPKTLPYRLSSKTSIRSHSTLEPAQKAHQKSKFDIDLSEGRLALVGIPEEKQLDY